MAEVVQFFPMDVVYKVVEGKAVINLYGKTADSGRIVVLDAFEPYFYVIPRAGADISEKIGKLSVENENGISFVTKTENVIKNFLRNFSKRYHTAKTDAIKRGNQ